MTKTPNALKQESFLVSEEVWDKKKIIRQDRIPVPEKKVFIQINESLFEVLNISSFGISVICMEREYSKLNELVIEKKTIECSLIYEKVEIQKLTIKLVRIENLKYSVFNDKSVGFEVLGTPISMDCIKALELTDEMIQLSNQKLSEISEIPNEFKIIVFEMKEFLLFLKDKIGNIEKSAPTGSENQNLDFRSTVTQSVSDYLSQIFPAIYQKIPAMIENIDSKKIEICVNFIRYHIGHLIYDAPFANRAFFKPRGYAGDYEMMNHLYRSENVGNTLYDQCIHRYLIDEPAAQAVKNRGQYLFEKIKSVVEKSTKNTVRILAVASGPAKEQQLFLQNCTNLRNKHIEFVCIDQDEESLKHAQRELLSIERFAKTGFQFKFINLAIKNLFLKGLPENNFDLIYTAGLFDYFTDPVAQTAARALYSGLAEEGKLIIGNFSTSNPTKTLMEMILDWNLIYRSSDDLIRLFSNVGRKLEIENESLGINLFAILHK